MATLNIINNLPGTGNFAGRGVFTNKFFPSVFPKFIRASSKQEARASEKAKESIKHVDDQVEEAADKAKHKVTSTANQVSDKAKGTTENVTSTAQTTLSAKAKQVWETAIETAQKAKETVLGKTDDSKENAEKRK